VQRGGQRDGLVELNEVAGGRDELEPGAGDEAGKAACPIDGYPPVLLTPNDQGREPDVGVEGSTASVKAWSAWAIWR
jgi:hypothetical protein